MTKLTKFLGIKLPIIKGRKTKHEELTVEISAEKINQLIGKYGYSLVMDQLHDDKEIEKYGEKEKNFNHTKYLTIKMKDIVVGRIYQINTKKLINFNQIKLNQQQFNTVIAYFKFFEIPNSKKIVNALSQLAKVDVKAIPVELIRNNVYKQEAY